MGMTTGRAVVLLDAAGVTGDWQPWPGGQGACIVEGPTFGGATVNVQFQGPVTGEAFTLGADATLTKEGIFYFTAPPGNIRAEVSGGTTPEISANAIPLPRAG